MKVLTESHINISGFASVRERVLLQSRRYFNHQPEELSFDEFGSLLYLANAWFTPFGSTKLHHHNEGIDIVSIIPRGEILHQGTIGEGERVLAGQVQIQRSGEQGFSHNEINPTEHPQPFIQLWFQPEHINQQASFELVDILDNAVTPIYQSFDSQLSILNFNQVQQWQTDQECLLFVYAGQARLQENEESLALERGMLIKAENAEITSTDQFSALILERV